MSDYRLTTAADLRTLIIDLRPDAVALGVIITADWCRDQMHAAGVTRYEDVDEATIDAVCAAVDDLAGWARDVP